MGQATILTSENSNKRVYQRSLIRTDVKVNSGTRFHGGMLYDFSYSGAAIKYPDDDGQMDNPLKVGQKLLLDLGGKVEFPARIVRIFDDGFATKFDFSLDLAMA